MKRKFFGAAFLFATGLMSSLAIAADIELKKGDHICLVGNALCERMQHHNYWESLLQQRYPELQLSVRNLGFPGDEPYERIRSENFGAPDKHLAHSKASVVMYFFGFNESFDGDAGLTKFFFSPCARVRLGTIQSDILSHWTGTLGKMAPPSP